MSKLSIILGSMMGGSKEYCPDCGCDMKSNGTCPDCGYGEEEDDMEGEDEGAGKQELLDIKNELQRVMEKIDRLIVNGD